MALIASVAISAGMVALGGALVGATATAIIVSTAVTFAVKLTTALIARSRTEDGTDGFTSEVQTNQTTVRSATAPVKLVYGQSIVGGVLVFSGISGDNNEFLHMVLVLTGHEVEAIGTVYFDELDENGEEIAGWVDTWKHTGADNQIADLELVKTFGEWTLAHRLQGCAYIHVRIRIDPNDDNAPFKQIPAIKARVYGRKVIDRRIPFFDYVTEYPFTGSTNIYLNNHSYVGAFLFKFVVSGLTDDTSVVELLQGGTNHVTVDIANMTVIVELDQPYTFTIDTLTNVDDEIIVLYYESTLVVFVNGVNAGTELAPVDETFVAEFISPQRAVSFSHILLSETDVAFPIIDLIRWQDQTYDDGGNTLIPNHGSDGDLIVTAGEQFTHTQTTDVDKWNRVWSKNSALNILDYLTWERFGLGASWDSIDVNDWNYQADICSRIDASNADPCPRFLYPLDGVIDTQNVAGNNLSAMLTSCGGSLTWANGKFRLITASPAPVVFNITSDDIISDVNFRVVGSKIGVFNTVKAKYVSASQNWQSAETEEYIDEQAKADDGGEKIIQELDLLFTDNAFTAQKLAITYLNLSRLEGGLSMTCKHSLFGLRAGDVGTLNIPEMGINGEKYRVAEWSLEPTTVDGFGGIQLLLEEYSDDAYDIPADRIRPPYEIPKPPVDDKTIASPTNFWSYSGSQTTPPFRQRLTDNNGEILVTNTDDELVANDETGSGLTFVLLGWDVSDSPYCVGYELTITPAGESSETKYIAGRLNVSYIDGEYANGTRVSYSLRAIRSQTIISDPSVLDVIVTDGTSEPPTPSDFNVTPNGGNNGLLTFNDHGNPDLQGNELRVGATFGFSAYMGIHVNVGSTVHISGADNRTFFLRSKNAINGVYSQPTERRNVAPADDGFDPAVDWGTYRFDGSNAMQVNGLIPHHTGALIPASQLLASAQDWETFDMFVQDPVDVAKCWLDEIPITAGDSIMIDSLVASAFPKGFPTPTGVDIAPRATIRLIVNNSVSGSIAKYSSDYGSDLIQYTAVANDTSVVIEVEQLSIYGTGFVPVVTSRRGGSYARP